MRKIKLLTMSCMLASALFSCNNSSTKDDDNKKTTDSVKTAVNEKPAVDSANMPLQLNASFVEFTLGDAQHFMFKDEAGKAWDFGRDEDTTYKFAVEIPKAKANDANQGWGSDKALQGKWFHITYAYSNEKQYDGGPMAKVAVIKHVEPK